MLPRRPKLRCPGLFVTGTDTGVGKTVVTCAIAWQLRHCGEKTDPGAGGVGVCYPIATGCRRDREGLVSEDAEALAHFADCREPLDLINPVRYKHALAPAVAAAACGRAVDGAAILRSLEQLDGRSSLMLIEGVGGLLVPLGDQNASCSVLELIQAVGFPVLVVCRAGLGTLNHTAMTVRILQEAGCRVAGLVVNGYVADAAKADPSMATNRQWLATMNRTQVLATVPACLAQTISPQKGKLPAAVLEAVGVSDWPRILLPSR